MKSRKFCIIICAIFIPFFLFGQKNSSYELVELLNNGDFFRSKQLYLQICDTISPEIALYYKFQMARFMNKKDSASIYLEKILAEYPDLFGKERVNVYGILFDIYIDLGNYEKGICTYERIKQHLRENPYNMDKKELLEWQEDTEYRLRQLKYFMKQPSIRIKRKEINDSVKILGALKPLFIAKYNNVSLKTYFDTGAQSYCIMNSIMAERVGIKCDTTEISKGLVNQILTNKAILDSIEIGNIMVYNIPVWVYEQDSRAFSQNSGVNDSKEAVAYDSIYSCLTTPVTIGLPLMQLIGKLCIDNKGKSITFPISDDNTNVSKEPNLYIYNDNLYTRLKVNEKDFTGFLDTGADIFMDIDTTFFKNYENDIVIDSVTAKTPYNIVLFHQSHFDIPYMIPYKPIIRFEDKQIHVLKKRSVKIYPLAIWNGEVFDGIIGYHLFKRLGKKVLLDFENMRLEVEEELE